MTALTLRQQLSAMVVADYNGDPDEADRVADQVMELLREATPCESTVLAYGTGLLTSELRARPLVVSGDFADVIDWEDGRGRVWRLRLVGVKSL